MSRVLIADDEVKLGGVLAEMLELDHHEVTRVEDGEAAIRALRGGAFDIVLTDLRMPKTDGLSVLAEARGRVPPADVIVMTAHATPESAVAAMKAGAVDYLLKPFAMDEVRLKVKRLAAQQAAERRNERLLEQLTPTLVAESGKMREVLAAARQVASSDATVLVLGESGTGKTELARYVHFSSRRATGPFVEVHCAALPESLLESELFGYRKGAFTGATQDKGGHLVAAQGGTLFLDEIGELTAATQVKLLRFLQGREFVPVGSTEPRKVDTRVIAATNRDLAAAVREGAFREDFYYRLNVFQIVVPPLRERPEDIEPLALRFLASRGVPVSRIAPGALARLREQPWPGNVRELENALERAVILAGDGPIEARHLGSTALAGPRDRARAGDLLVAGFDLDDFEREVIHAAIERAGGNKSAAARLLGITRRRLYSRLESLGEPEPDPER